MTEAIVGVFLGSAFLYVFFKAIQLNWPESYFGVGELAAYAISASPWRYALFRFGPVLVTSLFVAVSVDRAGGDGRVAAIGTAGVHGLLTSGLGLAQAVRWPSDLRKHRRPILIIRGIVLFGAAGIGLLASMIRSALSPIVPPISEIGPTLWTGIIAGVLGAFIVQISRGHPVTEQDMIENSMKDIPASLWKFADGIALEHGVDADLTRAIMVVENLQRPSWFRHLERLKGRLLPAGTYGIMQVTSDRPLSDEESIEKVVIERLSGVVVKDAGGSANRERLESFAKTYNPSRDFASLLTIAYQAVRPDGDV